MSGGHWDYQDSEFRNYIFGWGCDRNKVPNVMEDQEISELLYDLLDLMHDYDWYISGDTDKPDYLKAKKEFKEKWLESDSKTRVKRQVDNAIEDVRNELYETFGISEGKTNE